MSTSDEVILCCVQDTPVSFDLQASLDKLSKLAREATTKARALASSPSVPIVVLFPEAFLSAYPRGLDFGAKIGSRTPKAAHGSGGTTRLQCRYATPKARRCAQFATSPKRTASRSSWA